MKCSVIVPVYNVEKYINECLDSILNQTYTDFEIILVDDGSTDGSSDVCDYYSRNHSNIKVIHKTNGGLSSARNAGIKVAKGDYLAFVDSDDMISCNYLETLVSYAEKYNADIVCADMNRGTEPDWSCNKEQEVIIRHNEEILDKMYIDDGKITVVWNKLYRRHLFDEILFKEGTRYEDMQIMPHLLNKAKSMVVTNDNIYFYRQVEGSITKKREFNHARLDLIFVVEDRILFLNSLNKSDLLNREIEGYIRKLIRYRQKMDKYTYTDNADVDMIEKKLIFILKNNLFNHKVGLKIKIKALCEIIKRKNFITFIKFSTKSVDKKCIIYKQ